MELLVLPGGRIRCVYEEVIDLASLGRLVIRRASHVEPAVGGAWTADLAPVSGPRLGPYCSRGEALEAERKWLETHWLSPAANIAADRTPA